MRLKVYIAHNYEARHWLKSKIVPRLQKFYDINARWITDESHDAKSGEQCAQEDIEDMRTSNMLMLCVDAWEEGETGRGKWFEFGFAYAEGKIIYLIGKDEACVFTNLGIERRFRSWEDLLEVLER